MIFAVKGIAVYRRMLAVLLKLHEFTNLRSIAGLIDVKWLVIVHWHLDDPEARTARTPVTVSTFDCETAHLLFHIHNYVFNIDVAWDPEL